jgi:putative ABC transport system permease protein
MGGAIGLLLVYILTLVFTHVLEFPVFVSIPLLIGTVAICLIVGMLAGIFPASRAAKMDPVEAIRSK